MSGEFHRALGLELSGAKNDRTALVSLDFYPKTKRLILSDLESKITGVDEISADETLVELISAQVESAPHFSGIGVHGPTSLPPYLETKDARFPQKSSHPQVRWMNETWKKLRPRPRPFVPYLQRPAEIWLRYFTPEKFQMPDALGSNSAPLAARLHFLSQHLPEPVCEVFPKATLSRVISSLGLAKSIVRDHADLERGISTREQFFTQLVKKIPQIFIYEKDLDFMILNINAFYAFLAALTQHLLFRRQCESPPKSFPKSATWVYLPTQNIQWETVFAP